MLIEINIVYDIGDCVLVKKPHVGAYFKPEEFEAKISGYVIHKTDKQTKVYYTIQPVLDQTFKPTAIMDYGKKKKYLASELEKIS